MAILKHRFPRNQGRPLPRYGLTGASPSTLVRLYEELGELLNAGLMHARMGNAGKAIEYAKICEDKGRYIDAMRIYLAVDMRTEAAESAGRCTGGMALEAAKLLVDVDPGMAKGCADRFVESADPATLGVEQKAVLQRVYIKAGDRAANRFAPPAWHPRKHGMDIC